MSRLGVIVPAYRPDVVRLEAYLHELAETLEPAILRVEIDAPAGGDLERLEGLDLDALEVNANPYRRGKGAAITAGFEAIDTETLAFVDADGSTPAAELGRIVSHLEAADVAVGSRRHPDARVADHQTVARRFMGDGFSWLARRVLEAELYDYQCGAKAITAAAWNAVRVHLYQPGFAWDVELVAMASALEFDIIEVPIDWADRPGSTVSPVRSSLSMLKALAVCRHRARRLQQSRRHDTIASGDGPVALVDREWR